MSETLPIELSAYEIVYLCDSINNKDVAEGLEEEKAYVPLARQALLILGSAYREVVSPEGIKGSVQIQITEDIAWLLRGKVRTGDIAIDGQTNIGVSLLLKLYGLLLEFNSGVADIKTSLEDEPPITPVSKQLLKELQEKENAGRNPEDNAYPYDGSLY